MKLNMTYLIPTKKVVWLVQYAVCTVTGKARYGNRNIIMQELCY